MAERKVTIARARERLGAKSARLKDKEIQEVLNALYFLCEQVVEQTVKGGRMVRERENHAN